MAANRVEYREHEPVIDEFKQEAEGGGSEDGEVAGLPPPPVRRPPSARPSTWTHAHDHPRRPQPRLRRRVHVLRARRGQDRHRRPALRPRAVRHRVAEPARPPGGARGHRGLDPRLRLSLARLRPARLRLLDGRRLRPAAGGHAARARPTRAPRSRAPGGRPRHAHHRLPRAPALPARLCRRW